MRQIALRLKVARQSTEFRSLYGLVAVKARWFISGVLPALLGGLLALQFPLVHPPATPVFLAADVIAGGHPAPRHVIDPVVTPTAHSSPTARATASPIARRTALPAIRLASGLAQQALINGDRRRAGLAPLQWNDCLASIAVQNARRMALQGYISHNNGRIADLGCHLGSTTGENIGFSSPGINDAQMNSWFMNSPIHRANILGPFHYVGISWAVANGVGYLAVEFG